MLIQSILCFIKFLFRLPGVASGGIMYSGGEYRDLIPWHSRGCGNVGRDVGEKARGQETAGQAQGGERARDREAGPARPRSLRQGRCRRPEEGGQAWAVA